MNILYIENNFSPTLGGVERVTYTLGEALRERGYNVYYAFRGIDDACLEHSHNLKFNDSLSNSEIADIFINFITKNQISLLICQNLHNKRYQYIYNKIKQTCNVHIIACLHSNPDIWVNKNKWGYTFPKIYIKELIRTCSFKLFRNPYKEKQIGMYNIADKYVLLSESFKLIFCKLNNINGNKLLAIPNPCAFTAERYNETSKKENILLVVARMAEQQKRVSNVIEIWSRLENAFKDWKLILVGDGPDINNYKQMVKNKGLQHVEFVGKSESPQKYYAKAKIFLMTSVWEGFGMTLIEAQHYGCVPFAYNSYAAVFDIINNGENGMIIPHHDITKYCEELKRLMKDDIAWQKMSVNAMTMNKNKFGLDSILNQWILLFNELN